MKRATIATSAGIALLASAVPLLAAIWLRERRARTVFPASQASALLNPARRLIQSPQRVVADAGIGTGEQVLELGPGPGYFTPHAVAAVGPRGRITCADVQPAMLGALRCHLGEQGARNIAMVAADAQHLPFRDGNFDRALLVAVLGEVPDPLAALHELRRVVRRGGVIAIGEMLTDPDYIREGALRRLCDDARLTFISRRRSPLGYVARFARTAY